MEVGVRTAALDREKLRRQVAPDMRELLADRAAEIDRTGEYPTDVFDAFVDRGWFSLSLPLEMGGISNGVAALTVVTEEAARTSTAAGLMLLLSRLPVAPILLAGTPQQCDEFVRPQGAGKLRGAFAMSEPQAGSDLMGIAAQAAREGDIWRINGRKAWISGGAEADWFLVVAREAGTPQRSGSGIRAFIVDANAPGLVVSTHHDRPGGRGVSLVDITLTDVEVPEDRRLPGIRSAGPLLGSLASMRPIISARGTGLAAAALDLAVARVKQRMVGGRPLAEQQGIQWQLADVAARLEAAFELTHRAAAMIDAGEGGPALMGKLAVTKLSASQIAVEAAMLAAQLHGAEGCLAGHPVDRMVRDSRQLTVVEGTSEIQRTIIARALLDGQFDWATGGNSGYAADPGAFTPTEGDRA
jgi:hypothetical protein